MDVAGKIIGNWIADSKGSAYDDGQEHRAGLFSFPPCLPTRPVRVFFVYKSVY